MFDHKLLDQTTDIATLTPAKILEAIETALAAGAHADAQRLATLAATIYPAHPEVAKAAKVLARPTVKKRQGGSNGAARRNQLWLKRNFEQYRDQWVALQDGHLLGVADSLPKLRSMISDTTNVIITRV
jgi:hypothetical protein